MPVPGHDPDDITAMLESRLSKDELEEYLSNAELDAYAAGEADLVDLLNSADIQSILDDCLSGSVR